MPVVVELVMVEEVEPAAPPIPVPPVTVDEADRFPPVLVAVAVAAPPVPIALEPLAPPAPVALLVGSPSMNSPAPAMIPQPPNPIVSSAANETCPGIASILLHRTR